MTKIIKAVVAGVAAAAKATAQEINELASCLIYLVSPQPRGADNFWARTLNGCDKLFLSGAGTASVSITPNGRYVLTCDPDFFRRLSAPLKKLILIHEAGHLALRHIERLCRIMMNVQDPLVRFALKQVFNYAADFCVNDSVLRLEPEFKKCHLPKSELNEKNDPFRPDENGNLPENITRITFLLPEEFGFPRGLSMWDYIKLMLKDLPKLKKQVEDLLEQLEKEEAAGGEGGEGGEEGGDEEGGEGGDGGSGSPGKKAGKGKSKGGGTESADSDDDPGIPPGLAGKALSDPEAFQELKRLLDKLNRNNHKEWNEAVEKLNPQEAQSMANKLKNHARRLVKTASEQTRRSRGTLPAGIENLVKGLLAEEQVPWTWLLNDLVAGSISSKVVEAMASPNTSLMPLDYLEPWPGNTMDFAFNIVFVSDSSGSVSDAEYNRACNELNGILKTNKSVKLRHIICDAAIQHEEMVDNLQPPSDEELRSLRQRRGYGGTSYAPAFRRIVGMDTANDWVCPKPEEPCTPPDLVIVHTDGGVVIDGECFPQFRPNCPIIWLVAPGCMTVPGMSNTAPDRVIQMFDITPDPDA